MIRQRCALRFSCFGFLLISLKPKFRKKTKVNDGFIQTDFSSFRVHFFPDILNKTIKQHNRMSFHFQEGYKENQSGETEL